MWHNLGLIFLNSGCSSLGLVYAAAEYCASSWINSCHTHLEALERVLSPDFKTSSCPVVIDFLIRHGHINPDTEPAYPEIVELLHVPLQSMYKGFQNGTTVTSNNEIDGINNKLL
ncbi:uncharacterized protein LOC120355305 [Nilaparvata lugens]|uniref:uncharacterized protein LOC120355305 n=1 Tax=Nilaparvata lugens TaxID=108931 RepID=UPI00193DC2AD|nr:uncharacterized protein LOC120355305 [Nilaparvata lugens]